MSMGLVDIKRVDKVLKQEIRQNEQLYLQNNSNVWWLYGNPNSSVTFDFKNSININRIQFHVDKLGRNYPWSARPPSYAIEFSNDDQNYDIKFAEQNSQRINENISDAFYSFYPEIRYRYMRLRITDYILNESVHGMYISWIEFYTSSIKEITCKVNHYWSFSIIPLFVIIFF